MRFSIVTLGVLAAGCAAEPVDAPIRYGSTLARSTSGLVLHETGERGHAGMSGTNCPFETRFGRVTGDYDLPDSDEEVQDGGESVLGDETVLLVQPHMNLIHLLEKSTGDYITERVRWHGIQAGRLTDDGLVGLVDEGDGCFVQWKDGEDVVGEAPAPHCDPDHFDAHPDGAVLFGFDDRAVLVRPDGGEVEVDAGGELVVFDAALDHWYVARHGETTVIAIDAAGARLWSTEVAGGVTALGHAGRKEAAVVSMELDDGRGAVAYLDGRTGEELAWIETPSAAPELTTSLDGSTLALVLPDETHFYGVDSLE